MWFEMLLILMICYRGVVVEVKVFVMVFIFIGSYHIKSLIKYPRYDVGSIGHSDLLCPGKSCRSSVENLNLMLPGYKS